MLTTLALTAHVGVRQNIDGSGDHRAKALKELLLCKYKLLKAAFCWQSCHSVVKIVFTAF